MRAWIRALDARQQPEVDELLDAEMFRPVIQLMASCADCAHALGYIYESFFRAPLTSPPPDLAISHHPGAGFRLCEGSSLAIMNGRDSLPVPRDLWEEHPTTSRFSWPCVLLAPRLTPPVEAVRGWCPKCGWRSVAPGEALAAIDRWHNDPQRSRGQAVGRLRM